jgi:hypothetical protein
MFGSANSQTLRTANFIVGPALMAMVSPKHGDLPEKPAGVRTAIELINKRKISLRPVVLEAAFV